MPETHYFFIDECGDPEFYGKRKKLLVGTEGFQPLLILGMVETPNRKTLQKAILELKAEILSDPLYNTIYSVSQPDFSCSYRPLRHSPPFLPIPSAI